jgi:hypothetical protein
MMVTCCPTAPTQPQFVVTCCCPACQNAHATAPAPTPAPPQKRACIIGGFGMTPGDGYAYWKIAADLIAMGYAVDCFAWDDAKKIDLTIYDFVVCYSYGVARFFKDLAGKIKAVVLAIAGVPNQLQFGQWDVSRAGAWPINAGDVASCVCLQVDSYPESCPLAAAPWDTLTPANEDANAVDLTQPFLNVNCDVLIKSWLPWERHTQIKDTAFVRTLASRIGRQVLAAVTA